MKKLLVTTLVVFWCLLPVAYANNEHTKEDSQELTSFSRWLEHEQIDTDDLFPPAYKPLTNIANAKDVYYKAPYGSAAYVAARQAWEKFASKQMAAASTPRAIREAYELYPPHAKEQAEKDVQQKIPVLAKAVNTVSELEKMQALYYVLKAVPLTNSVWEILSTPLLKKWVRLADDKIATISDIDKGLWLQKKLYSYGPPNPNMDSLLSRKRALKEYQLSAFDIAYEKTVEFVSNRDEFERVCSPNAEMFVYLSDVNRRVCDKRGSVLSHKEIVQAKTLEQIRRVYQNTPQHFKEKVDAWQKWQELTREATSAAETLGEILYVLENAPPRSDEQVQAFKKMQEIYRQGR